jgi:hypothetical protein
MALQAKKMVREFLESGFYYSSEKNDKYLHPEAEIFWNSTSGYYKLTRFDFKAITDNLNASFDSWYCEVGNIIREDNELGVRFSYFVQTIENPDEEVPIADFIGMLSLKEGKIHRGYLVSQPNEDSPHRLEAFAVKKN